MASVVCSGCFQIASGPEAHVIPWFNDSVNDYLTTYRCEICWKASLEETRERVRAHHQDSRELSLFFEFFKRHGVVVLEHERGDPPDRQLPLALALLDQIEQRKLILNP